MWTDLTKKWVQEAFRVAVMAAIAGLITWALDVVSSGAIPLNPYLVGIITTALKSADRAVHETKTIKSDGILPF